MSPELPAALAVAGTALLALAFFGPFRRPVDAAEAEPAARAGTVTWPALVDASAPACDVAARVDLADALGALRTEWAQAILRRAYETEPDPFVRSAIETALRTAQDAAPSSTQSLVM